ncbi:MAG: transporter substrate-binding domain-containing protein [Spirochaetales bacterium]|nr:MAG: transporter substrate-binding domain-containing protein [Spirochaetales bacterium]
MPICIAAFYIHGNFPIFLSLLAILSISVYNPIVIRTFLLALSFFLAVSLGVQAEPKLTVAEKDWLASSGEIVFVGQTSYPPFEFIHPRRGEYSGMAIELIRWMATEYGFDPVFKPMPFAAAQKAVLDGSADALTGIFRSPEREQRFSFTTEVFSIPASIFVKSERTDILDPSDLDGKLVAVQRGDYAIEFLKTSGIDVKFLYTDDFASALQAVAFGDADALIGDEQIVFYHIYNGRLTEAIKKTGTPLYVGSDCMAAIKGNDLLVSILDKGLARARANGTLSRIYEKWLGVSYAKSAVKTSIWTLPFFIVLGVAILLAIVATAWTIQLNHLVKLKTAELSALNGELKKSNQSLTAANAQLVRDMEERSRLEEERRHLEARMVKAQSYESMAIMAGGIAHDFSNLLTAIIGGIDVALLSIDADSDAFAYLRDSLSVARQAGDLARRMLDFSGRTVFSNEALDLNELVSESAKVLQAMAPHKVPIRYLLSDQTVIIRGDPVQLRQVLANLVSNAAEASSGRNVPVTVRVAIENLQEQDILAIRSGAELAAGRYAVLETSDEGTGIAPDVQDRIFDPFYTTKKTGRGLGLAALAGIVKAHAGGVAVRSEPGKGTTVSVYLPLHDASFDEQWFARETGEASVHFQGTVLLIDGDGSILKTTTRILSSMGLSVCAVSDCHQAIDEMVQGACSPDLAIVDVDMTDQDGLATISQLKTIRPNLSIIVSTGYEDDATNARVRNGDFAGILPKPYGRHDLIKAILSANPHLSET